VEHWTAMSERIATEIRTNFRCRTSAHLIRGPSGNRRLPYRTVRDSSHGRK